MIVDAVRGRGSRRRPHEAWPPWRLLAGERRDQQRNGGLAEPLQRGGRRSGGARLRDGLDDPPADAGSPASAACTTHRARRSRTAGRGSSSRPTRKARSSATTPRAPSPPRRRAGRRLRASRRAGPTSARDLARRRPRRRRTASSTSARTRTSGSAWSASPLKRRLRSRRTRCRQAGRGRDERLGHRRTGAASRARPRPRRSDRAGHERPAAHLGGERAPCTTRYTPTAIPVQIDREHEAEHDHRTDPEIERCSARGG